MKVPSVTKQMPPGMRHQDRDSQVAGAPLARVHFDGLILLSTAAVVLTSCTGTHPLRGGKAVITHSPTGTIQQSLSQSENPAQPTRQDQESIKVRTYTLPAGARIEERRVQALEPGIPVTNVQSIVLSAPMPVVEREESRAKTELGAAQKDSAREVGARLSSLRPITWAGLGLFVFGLASLVWRPLKALIGSVTTSSAILAGGLALLILPTLIVGNELLILGAVGLTTGAWFVAHRHGQLRGQLNSQSALPTNDANEHE